MWSLTEKKEENGLLKENNLDPLKFSNNKTQEDVVKEVLQAIDDGNKIVLIHGVCGTGKSAIALNLAKELGKASIVVPIKSLQKQYEQDYTEKKHLLKNNGEKLKIQLITGRQNHKCPFLDEQKIAENYGKNAKLEDFENKKTPSISRDNSCDNSLLPCKIEIKEKNSKAIYDYLKRNENVDTIMFSNINDVRRRNLASICPYWSPVWSVMIDLNLEAKRSIYTGLCGKKFCIYQRKLGCSYYNQFLAYLNADVLIFNSEKYKLETTMDRKPCTEVEIIDECDEFLDNLSNSKKINLNRFYVALGNLFSKNDKTARIIHGLIILAKSLLNNPKIDNLIETGEIIKLKETKITEILQNFLDADFLDEVECDEENYCYKIDEIARTFKNLLDETYVSFYMDEKDICARLVTINLEKKFSEFIEKNKIVILMSGTIHSEEILKNVFGLKKFKIIEAETKMPGTITRQRTGQEFSCSYENFQKGFASRKNYLLALDKCITLAKKPALVHVIAFKDLPTEHEIKIYNLNILSREKLINEQKHDKLGKKIRDFKDKKIDILYTTRCSRGADFPGQMCNSIIITRYPYPNVSSIFWQLLKKTKPEHYHSFYMDKARREFLQRIYRALRSKDDHVFLLSPDIRVLMGRI